MKIIRLILVIIAIVTVPLSMYNDMPILAILPVTAVFLDIFTNLNKRFFMKSVSVTIFYLSFMLRFIVLPFSIVLSGNFYSIGRQPDQYILNTSILLMWFELIINFLVVNFMAKRQLEPLYKDIQINRPQLSSTPKSFILFIFLSLIFVILYPNILNNFKFVFSGIDTETTSIFRGIDVRILQFTQIIIYLFVIEYLSKEYRKNKNVLLYILALVVAVINITIIRNDNRATILINAVSTYLILVYLFPRNYKSNILTGTLGVLSVLIYVSILRNEKYNLNTELSGINDIYIYIQTQIQAYLSGPSYIANGLELFANGNYFLKFDVFANDILLWSGYFGNFIFENISVSNINTSLMFNTFIYSGSIPFGSGDQIIPLSIQGFAYLNIIGYFLFPMIMPLLMIYFERMMILSKYLIIRYNYLILVIVTSLYMGYNLSIFGLYFFDRFFIYGIFIGLGLLINHIMKNLRRQT